jgi:hypothetical protein
VHTLEPSLPTNAENYERAAKKILEGVGKKARERSKDELRRQKQRLARGIKNDTGINLSKIPTWPFLVAAAAAEVVYFCATGDRDCNPWE